MDYLLAAHIQVTGGAEAASQINQVVTQINHFGAAAKNSGTSNMASDMDAAAKSSGTLSAALGKVGDAAIRMATYMSLHAVLQGFRAAVDGVLDFDSAMTNSLSIQQGVTGAMRADMEDMAKSVAVEFGEMPGDVAEGFYFLASAGLDVSQQLATLPTVAAFAKAGMMDLDQATEMLFDSLSAIGQKSDDPVELANNLEHLADVLTQAAIASQGTIEQFGASLSNKAGGSIKAFGLDLEESVGLLEVFADQGVKGKVAGERFSMLIRDMALKSQNFGDVWKAVGVEVFDSSGNFNSLVTIFTQLDAALLPLSGQERITTLKSMGFTLRDIATVMSVLGTSSNLAAFVSDLERAGGVAERVAKTQMEALREKLNQLKAVTLVFAIDGFEKIETAAAWLVDTFSPAVAAVADVLKQLAQGAAPVALAFGGLIAAGVVEGLQGIASAIETVFNVIGQHQGAVEALGFALAALAVSQVVGVIGAIAASLGETLALKALYAADAIKALVASMRFADAAGAISVLKSAWSGFLNLLNTPIVAGLPAVALITGLMHEMDEGKKKANEFFKELSRGVNLGSLSGVRTVVVGLQEEYDRLAAKQDALANDNVFQKLFNVAGTELSGITRGVVGFGDNLAELGARAGATKEKLDELKAVQANMEAGFREITGWTQHATDGVFVIDQLAARMQAMGQAAEIAGVKVDTSVPTLQRLAAAAKLDLTKDWHEWAPVLEAAAIKSAMLGDNLGQVDSATTALSTDLTPFEDKLKAFGEIVKFTAGGLDDQFSATTKTANAFAELGTAMGAAPATFDVLTEAGRKQRDALSGVVDVVREMAEAHATATGDLGQGANALLSYSTGLTRVFQQAGLTKPAITDLLTQFGLTPEQIQTVFTVVADPALGAVHQVDEGMANVASSAAIAAFNLSAFQAALEALVAPASKMAMLEQAANSMIALQEQTAKFVASGGDLATLFDQNSKAANDLTIAFDGTVQGHIKAAQELANNGDMEGGKQLIIGYRGELVNLLASFGLAPEQIQPMIDQLGLSDAAINNLNGKKAEVTVTDNGTAATTAAAIDGAAPPTKQTDVFMEADAAALGLTESQLTTTTRPRDSQANQFPTGFWDVEAAFTSSSRGRDSQANQYGTGWPTVEDVFNRSSRGRQSNANQYGTGFWDVESNFSSSARGRTSTAHQVASGWDAANELLNYAARNRTSTINVVTTTSTVYAGPLGTGIAEGGIVHAYASGGFENHVAQIGKMGHSRIWNEPETGGEAYIPLALSKRARSLAIWEETGRMLGAQSTSQNVNVSAPISIDISGAGDPAATAHAVAGQVQAGVEAAMSRVLVELRSA